MEEIGVTAVVEGLSSFVSDMGKVQSSIEGIVPPASILQDAFSALGEAASSFASWVADVLTYTLGNLLADAIEGIISLIGEMISKTIEAGNEFQTLDLRLRGMNLDALMKSGMSYNDATQKSIDLTKEQLNWLQKLAVMTPYDNTDISQTYSLARAYGFTDEEARQLTQDTGNFSAAMGLTGDTLERIIRNFGQMRARGKITGTELRDLARGAFLPLDDVLGRIAKKMGTTIEALTKEISKPGGGVDEQLFINAFQEMVAQEPRFTGAAERMARTFGSATDNVQDLVKSFGGLNVVKPVLDVLGSKIADFMDQFAQSGKFGIGWTDTGLNLMNAAKQIGKALSDIVAGVLDLLPDSNTLANSLVSGVQYVADWLSSNKDSIVGKIKEISTWFQSLFAPNVENATNMGLMAFLRDLYDQLFKLNPGDKITGFQMLKIAIQDVGNAIGEVLQPFLEAINPRFGETHDLVANLVLALFSLAQWIRDNQEMIRLLLEVIIGFIILQTITNLVWSFIAGLVGIVITVVTVLAALGSIIVIAGNLLLFIGLLKVQFEFLKVVFAGVFTFIAERLTQLVTNIVNTFNNIRNAIVNKDWPGLGMAIINGIVSGIKYATVDLVIAMRDAAMAAYNQAMTALGIHSPSKLFAGVGENLMLGMAEGIRNSTGAAVAAMNSAVAAVAVPAMSAPSITQQYTQAAPKSISSTYQTSNQFNLNINSSANTEPVIQDFNMLSSMAGV